MENTICNFLSIFVEAVILYEYASTLFFSKRKIKIRLTVLCILYLFLFAITMLHSAWLNTFLYLFVNYVFLITQYQLKWYPAFFHSAILTAVMGICELAVYSIIQNFVPHFEPQFYAEAAYFHFTIVLIIFSKLLFFMIINIFIHFMKGQKSDFQQNDHSVLLLIIIPLTSVFIMLTFLTIHGSYMLSSSTIKIITLDAVFLLITNLLVFGFNQYNLKKSRDFTEMQLLLQKETNLTEYYQMLFSQNENQSILIHDIKKHLQSIYLLNENRKHDKIASYINQLMLSADLKEATRLCDHEMLNTILYLYKRQCDNKQISFHVDIRHGTIDFIADNDLTSLFGNLLDNAVEAASGIPKAFIEISSVKKDKVPFTVITMINSSRINPFSNPQGLLTTQKGNKHRHGFGMKSIQKTVSKYHGDMQIYYHDDSLTFHTIITLKVPDLH